MRTRLRPQHLLWFLPVAAVAVSVACGESTPESPTAATSLKATSDSPSGSDSGPTPGSGGAGSGGSGTLSVVIKDSPFREAKALLVMFSEISVHMSGGDWMTLPFDGAVTTRTCDLKRLETSEDVLGVGTLPAGHYTQVRLTVSSAKIYFTARTSASGPVCAPALALTPTTDPGVTLEVASGTLKLNREFDVPAGGATKILLDFDGDKSVHETGKGRYKMSPVIGVVSIQ